MSILKIRAALETALASMTPALLTGYENVVFNPSVGTPYARAALLMATPDNPVYGGNFYRERGVFYVTLCYPMNQGTAAVMARAESIKAFFARGNSYAKDGVTVHIERTAEIAPAQIDPDTYNVPIKIRIYADING